MNRQDVHFSGADGIVLSGNLYQPEPADTQEALPAILLCQGLSGEKQKVLPYVATAFAAAGFGVLAFDYAGCGESQDRRKRPYVFPTERIRDARAALDFLSRTPNVNTDRLGVYGISYGGPVSIAIAATEPRIQCAVAVSGPGDGPAFLSSLMEPAEWDQLLKEIDEDRKQREAGGESRTVPLERIIKFPQTFWARYAQLESRTESESLPTQPKAAPRPMLSLESAEDMLTLLPSRLVTQISPRPLLFVLGEKDDVAHIQLARDLFDQAKPPKEFAELPGMDHIDLDTGEGLQKQIELSLHWFRQHL